MRVRLGTNVGPTSDESRRVTRAVIWMFLLFVVLQCLTNVLIFYGRTGFRVDAIIQTYLGKAGTYGAAVPRSYMVLLEVSHSHLFAMGILVLTLTHLLLFVPAPTRIRLVLVFTAFGTALLEEGASWLIRFVHPGFAYLKLLMFFAAQLSLIAIVVLLCHVLITKTGPLSSRPASEG